ncbi:MAG: DUF4827 family protein [Bacteroidales bacterium]
MRKLFYFISLFLVGIMVVSSCSKTKSYSQLLSEEKDAIKKFIRDSSFVIHDELPKEFGPKDYYKFQRYQDADVYEVYVNIVSFGDTTRAKEGDKILLRTDDAINVKDNSIFYTGNIHGGNFPLQFINKYPFSNSGGCLGWALPLEHIGVGAELKLIIGSKSGLSNQQQSVVPLFFKSLTYSAIL